MLIVWVPFFVCIIGVLVWVLAKTEPVKRIGEYMFACGLLVTLFEVGTKVIHVP